MPEGRDGRGRFGGRLEDEDSDRTGGLRGWVMGCTKAD